MWRRLKIYMLISDSNASSQVWEWKASYLENERTIAKDHKWFGGHCRGRNETGS
jgi:hypothetical protein